MNPASTFNHLSGTASSARTSSTSAMPSHTFHTKPASLLSPVLTQFGEQVDVRKRGALRMSRLAGGHEHSVETPAVVRLWHEDQCRELSAHQARALASQLLLAADLVDSQNRSV